MGSGRVGFLSFPRPLFFKGEGGGSLSSIWNRSSTELWSGQKEDLDPGPGFRDSEKEKEGEGDEKKKEIIRRTPGDEWTMGRWAEKSARRFNPRHPSLVGGCQLGRISLFRNTPR
jgi:hypothetical protein